MACNSASVQRVADTNVNAYEQIRKLRESMLSVHDQHETEFRDLISKNLKLANVSDEREVLYNYDIKTEYTSEFNLDKISQVVITALKAVAKATSPTSPNPATSPEALEAYADLVNSVAESAKSTSTASASQSFSMTRLCAGMFCFLYATTASIKDEETFGTEAVTSTAVYYAFMQSIDDIKNQAEFDLATIDAKALVNMKNLQACLVDELANGNIDIDLWSVKDSAYDKAIARLQERLDNHNFDDKVFKSAMPMSNDIVEVDLGTNEVTVFAGSALRQLCEMGDCYADVVALTQSRIEQGYFA